MAPDNFRAGSNLKGKNNRNTLQASGLYQHISPPRAVPALKPSTVRQWLAEGDVAKLSQLVTDGQGHRLLGEHGSLHATKVFLRSLPGLMARQEAVHAAVDEGRVEDVRTMVEKGDEGARLAVSKDAAGLGLLHKAVLRGHEGLVHMLISKFPALVHLRDHEGRTPLHYCGAAPDPMQMWSILEGAGADKAVVDRRGNRARTYMGIKPVSTGSHTTQGSNVATSMSTGDLPAVVTAAHIRRWIHERDLPRLERLVWSGQGERLLPETSSIPRVRRFLDAVPCIMSIIKEVHMAAVNNNMSLWRMRTAPPAPTHLILSQDRNGLTPLHKAAGLGHSDIAGDIIQRTSSSAVMRDMERRLPLHYAAIHKATSPIYQLLLDAGADENIPDVRGRPATYYAQHPSELNTAALGVAPEAPRAPTHLPPGWNWNMLTLDSEAFIPRPGDAFNFESARITLPSLPKPSFNLPFRTGNPSIKPLQNGYLRTGNVPLPRPNFPYKAPSHSPPKNIFKPPPPKTVSPNKAVVLTKSVSPTKAVSPTKFVSPTKTASISPTKLATEPPISEQIADNPEPEHSVPVELVAASPNKTRSTLSTAAAAVTSSRKANTTPLALAVAALTQKKTLLNSSTPPTTFSFSPNVSSRAPLINGDNLSKTFPLLMPHSAPDHVTTRGLGGEFVIPNTAPSPGQRQKHNGKYVDDDDLLFGSPIRPITPPGSRMAAPVLERWVRAGNLARLEDALLEGRGHRVLKLIANAAKTQDFMEFIDRAPGFMGGMRRMHEATAAGDVAEVKEFVSLYRRIVLARDDEGLQPMHVAARAGNEEMLRLLLRVFPRGAGVPDWEGRTPLHYAGMCPDADNALSCYQLLLAYAAPENAKDAIGNKASDYLVETRTSTIDMPVPMVAPSNLVPTEDVIPNNHYLPAEHSNHHQGPAEDANHHNDNTDIMHHDHATIEDVTHNHESTDNDDHYDYNHGTPDDLQASKSFPEENMTEILNDLNDVSHINGHARVCTSPPQMNIPSDGQGTAQAQHQDLPDIAPQSQAPETAEVRHEGRATETEVPQDAVRLDAPKNPTHNTMMQPEGSETLISEALKPLPNPRQRGRDPILDLASRLVDARDTEKLAELVLGGHGDKLIGMRSSNAYVQGLIDHVPVYMKKIGQVHEAAARGDLAALQTALERRKFVTSRDQFGATPLHKAVLFRQIGVARYLGGRFPESLDAQDHAGRTPLHYAAVLPDRGMVYRSLLALGADPRKRDQRGHTALDYQLHHEQRRDHENLLSELGEDPSLAARPLDPAQAAATAAAAAATLDLLQQPLPPGSNGDNQQPQSTGYVMKSVGEPLLQGLKEVSNLRPKDPIAFLANYLYNFPHLTREVQGGEQAATRIGTAPDTAPSRRGTSERLQTAGSMTSGVGSTNRDEHGQSMLHFAAARAHSRHAFSQLLREAGLSVGQRDALYRTPRDVALEAGLPENARDIDAWVLHLALEGDTGKLEELLMDGYDHILDVKDENGTSISELVQQSNVQESIALLKAIPAFESKREWLHQAIRMGSLENVREVMTSPRLAVARNTRGRSSLHVAALCQQENMLEFIANTFPLTLGAGDNLERTALHYAMAMDKAEILSMLLIKAGAKRVLKDLKGRQASFYFVNRADIIKLSEEEMQEKNKK